MDILQGNWHANIADFKRNPDEFFLKNGMSEDTLTVDILQALWDEKLGAIQKIHLLSILQEYGSILLDSAASVEQAVGTLIDIYKQMPNEGNVTLKSHLLLTLVTLTLSNNILESVPDQFAAVVELLLVAICKTNAQNDRLIRIMACQGLQEIEVNYPGSLMHKMDHIYQMCQLETSPCCQTYLSLFSTILSNSIKVVCYQNKTRFPPRHISDLLVTRSEPLKPFVLPKMCLQYKTIKVSPKYGLPGNQDVAELKRAVSFLLDHTHLLTTPTLVTTLGNIADIVMRTSSISPSIFKWATLRYMFCYDISVLQFVIHLKSLFHDRLFQDVDQTNLLESILSHMTLLSVLPGQRLLVYEWMMTLPLNSPDMSVCPAIPELPHFKDYTKFFPSAFDGSETIVKKMRLLAIAMQPMDDEDMIAGSLVSCLKCLMRPLKYGVMGRIALSAFTVLFICYDYHQHWEFIERLKQLLVELVTSQPKYTPHVLDFVEAVESVQADKGLTSNLLSTMMATMTPVASNLPSSEEDIKHRLVLLQKIAMDAQTKPKAILDFLYNITQSILTCHHGNWLLGNLICDVVRSLMQYFKTDEIYTELGDLLHMVMSDYGDTDIQDRAKFYLSLLLTLSADKLMALFGQSNTHSNSHTGNRDLDSIISENSSFSPLVAVVNYKEPVLVLTRNPQPLQEQYDQDMDEVDGADILTVYEEHWKFNPVFKKLTFDCLLEINEDLEEGKDLSEMYAAVVQFVPDNHFQPMPDEVTVSLQVSPLVPAPGTISAVVFFTDPEGRTCCSPLDDIEMTFADLCTPLPCPSPWRSRSLKNLYDALWEKFTDPSSDDSELLYMESVIRLNVGEAQLKQLLETSWKRFIIAEEDQHEDTNLAMFLPPAHHLLMKIRVDHRNNNCIVSLATDNVNLLPMTSEYMKQIQVDSR